MIIVALILLGLCLGSFVNALVYRLYMQGQREKREERREKGKGQRAKGKVDSYSIARGRSMCPHCRHELAAKDLIPVLSWLSLRGKCRYCHKPISWQYPLVELATAGLFVLSYVFWPHDLSTINYQLSFAVWLLVLTGFVALTIYDLKWMLLPNKIIYPLLGLVLALAIFNVSVDGAHDWQGLLWGLAIGGGIFLTLFYISNGRWIGGGDVKLGALAGLLLADGFLAALMLLAASLIGTALIIPGLLLGKVKPTSRIPFGPFLILATILVYLFGQSVVDWYKTTVGL